MMSTATPQGPYVFLSYSRSEGVVAKRLEHDLRVNGFQVWRDVSSIDPGSPDWEEAIREAISHAYAVVLIASPSVIQSRNIKGELSLAKRYHPNRIYPVWVDGTDWPDCVPIDFINTQYIDVRGKKYAVGFRELLTVLQKAKEQPSPSPLPPDIEPPAQPPLPPPPPKPFPTRLMLIVGLVLLLIISSGVVFTIIRSRQSQPTVQLITDPSVIAANPNSYTPGSGKLALVDPLRDTSRNSWDVGPDDTGGDCEFPGDAYHVSQSKTNLGKLCYEPTDFSNFAFEVRMTIVKGDCGGIDFRTDRKTGKAYDFAVCQNGSYSLYLYESFSGTPIISSASKAIHTGLNASNVIAVVAKGSTLDLYVNMQKIASYTDSTYSHGGIALIAVSNKNPTEVVYSNARAWVL